MILLTGTSAPDLLQGLTGPDSIYGLDGDDTLSGDAGNDFLHGNRNRDSILGNTGDDTLRGGQDDDTLLGGNNGDLLYGDLGDDLLLGHRDSDTLYGGEGEDTLHGGQHDDTLYGGDPAIRTGDNDVLHGDFGKDFLQGNQNNDTLYGGEGADTLRGGLHDDSLSGDTGNDTLHGDKGNNILTGGAGCDQFVIRPDAGTTDELTDFDPLASDKIDLGEFTSITGFNQLNISTGGDGNDGIVALPGNQTLIVRDYHTLTGGHFIFSGQSGSTAPPPNSLPVVAGWDATPAYTEGDAALIIDNNVTITDADHTNLTGVTIQITDASDGANEVLAATDSGGVASAYDAGTRTLTLSGLATVANYQTVLQTVTYIHNSQNPTAGNRTLEVIADDGDDTSLPVSTTVTAAAVNDPPVNTVPGAQTTTQDTDLIITGVSIADVDDTTMDTVTLTVTNGTLSVKDDVVSGVTAGQITNNGTASVTVTGATVTALNTTFSDASGLTFSPTASYSGPATFTIVPDDGDDTDSDMVNISAVVANFLSGNLDGTDGFRLTGIDTDDESGISVSRTGDVNGDGFEDVIIGAYLAQPVGLSDPGESYVVFGKAGGFASNINLGALDGTDGFRLTGITNGDRSGFSVSTAGDVNGDGFDDVIIGAYYAEPGGGADNGESYVVFGSGGAWASNIGLGALDGSDGFRLTGVDNNDRSGFSVSTAGDVNGDGFDDVIIGAYYAEPGGGNNGGESYVVFGKGTVFASNVGLGTLDGTDGFRLTGIDNFDRSGISVSNAGDVNGDGFDDVIIGAYFAEPSGGNNQGESYVVLGKGTPFASNIGLGTLDGSDGFRLTGIDAVDWSGRSVSGAGDINNDGFDDVLIGAQRGGSGILEGESYVVFGKGTPFASNLDLSALDGTDGFRLTGIDLADQAGYSVSDAGDVNGDGFDDLLIGAFTAEPGGGNNNGEVYLIFGRGAAFASNIALSSLDGADGFRLTGIDNSDLFGHSVSAAGDVDGDGFSDIVIGAHDAEPGGGDKQGESYVVFGKDFTFATTETGTAGNDAALIGTAGQDKIDGLSGNDSITGGADADTLIGGQGDDTLDGEAGNDVIIGGSGDDIVVFGAGDTKLRGDRGDDTLRLAGGDDPDFTAIANNRILSFEHIDALTDAAANSITMDYLDMLALSRDTNTLRISGGANDTLTFTDAETIASPTNEGSAGGFTEWDFGEGFTLFVHDDMTILGGELP